MSLETLEATVGLLQKKVGDLEDRITQLESRLERCPGEKCPYCGALEYRLAESRPATDRIYEGTGTVERIMRCGECGKGETEIVMPGQ